MVNLFCGLKLINQRFISRTIPPFTAGQWKMMYVMMPVVDNHKLLNKKSSLLSCFPKWCGADSNRRHMDFQSIALPPELPHLSIYNFRYPALSKKIKYSPSLSLRSHFIFAAGLTRKLEYKQFSLPRSFEENKILTFAIALFAFYFRPGL